MARNWRAARRLLKTLGESDRLLVLTHENPDPDAIASGYALVYIATAKLGIEATLAYSGLIGRAENKAMVDVLGIELVEMNPDLLVPGQALAIVDAQPEAGNIQLPRGVVPSIVIDHHPLLSALSHIPIVDIRPWYGATSTILAEYLFDTGLSIPDRVATALFYGIKTDTQDLGRHTSEADREAYAYLWGYVDKVALPQIEYPRLPRQYFETFRTAIERSFIFDDIIVSSLDEMDNPNAVAEVADLLLRLEGMRWSLCTGFFGDHLYVSLRTSDPYLNAGEVVRKAMRGIGTSGGHGTMAGGKALVPSLAMVERRRAQEEVQTRLLRVLGVRPEVKELLLVSRSEMAPPRPGKTTKAQRHKGQN